MFSKIQLPVRCEYDYTRDYWVSHAAPINQHHSKYYDIDWVRAHSVHYTVSRQLDRKHPQGGFNLTAE